VRSDAEAKFSAESIEKATQPMLTVEDRLDQREFPR
jgi:hypothetical protein